MAHHKFHVKVMPLKHSGSGRVMIKYNRRDGAQENERVIITKNKKARCTAVVWGHEEAEDVIKLDVDLLTKLDLNEGDEVYLWVDRASFRGRLKSYVYEGLWFLGELPGILLLWR
ncbi:hypothetical protein GCM10007094_19740 [Pseudovibrio japonicus]|uniref:Uncharacterized protein n=1 Tax=Pseudovibrio japonicus TaxID=366534 RepID=A0ABQ3EA63_9HYPH|nr:hypothetical protein GCM10007094_19740 [Pseudovibrio japonicus]